LTRRDNLRPKHHLRATPKAVIINPLRYTITIQIDAQFSSSLSRYTNVALLRDEHVKFEHFFLIYKE
jgi:hypothetical protein